MPSNNPIKTPYLNLTLFALADTNTTSFNDFWHSIDLNGDGSTIDYSAFQLIDTAYHDLDVRVTNLPSQIKAEIAELFDDAMERGY